jgi:osmotically-inducible protein OsmY
MKSEFRWLALGAAAGLGALALSGCVPALVAAGAGATAVAMQDRTAGAAIDDGAASTEIRTRYFQAKGFSLNKVQVVVSEGFVLLTGSAPTPQDRIEAERLAWEVAQVKNVANEIQVGEGRRVGSVVEDSWITSQVRARLVGDNSVKGVNYNIETFEGTVYLLGIARTKAELSGAVEQARTVKGVQKVVSYVRVEEKPNIAQPETSAQAATARAAETGVPTGSSPINADGYNPYEAPQPATADLGPASAGASYARDPLPPVPDTVPAAPAPSYSPSPYPPAAQPAAPSVPATTSPSSDGGPVVLTPN